MLATSQPTGVQLLDPVAALASSQPKQRKQQQQQQQQQQQVPEALQQYHPAVQAAMMALGFDEATPVQERSWPAACAGKDLEVCAAVCVALVRLFERGACFFGG